MCIIEVLYCIKTSTLMVGTMSTGYTVYMENVHTVCYQNRHIYKKPPVWAKDEQERMRGMAGGDCIQTYPDRDGSE